jgi:hypothetical protein
MFCTADQDMMPLVMITREDCQDLEICVQEQNTLCSAPHLPHVRLFWVARNIALLSCANVGSLSRSAHGLEAQE